MKLEKEELNVTNSRNENVQEVVDQEVFVGDEGWIDVKRKERKKKNKYSKGNNVDDSLRNTSSVKSMKECVMEKDKERRVGELRKQLLKISEKSKSETNPAQRVNDSKKASVGLANISRGLESGHASFVANQESSVTETDSIQHVSGSQKNLVRLDNVQPDLKKSNVSFINQEDSVKVENTLEDKYLKQGARPKTGANSGQCVSYAKKVSAGLSSIGPVSEKKDSFSVRDNECTVAKTLDLVSSSNIVNVFSDESYDASIRSKSVSSGFCFETVQYKYGLSKGVVIKFCSQLKEFRELHFNYCIRLINRVFKIENSKLVVSESAKYLFARLTPNAEILFFILKVFFIINISTLCGVKSIINHLRYCSTHFYNQSLLDLLVSKVIINVSEEENRFTNGGTLKKEFEACCEHLHAVSNYEPYSSKFFQQVLDMCYDLTSVESSEENRELVDFAILACLIYCGHMLSVLCRMLVYNHDINIEKEGSLLNYLKAQRFCEQCHYLRKTMIHMYHITDDRICIKSVANLISVPLIIWRRCSKEIHNIVKDAVNRDSMDFRIFVEDMISISKGLILKPNTMRLYKENIKMYDTELKTVKSLLPLLRVGIICPNESSENSRFL
ncbi:DUF3514 domain-containing protein [Ehrlichia sp. JZT12]